MVRKVRSSTWRACSSQGFIFAGLGEFVDESVVGDRERLGMLHELKSGIDCCFRNRAGWTMSN